MSAPSVMAFEARGPPHTGQHGCSASPLPTARSPLGLAHRGAGVAGLGLVDGVHRQEADGVDAQLVQRHHPCAQMERWACWEGLTTKSHRWKNI